MIRRTVLFAFLLASTIAIAQTPKVESIGPFSGSGAPAAVVNVLEAKGYRIPGLADIWFAKSVAETGKSDPATTIYPKLDSSAFVGVITFTGPAKDFRGQPIRPGTYIMRYEKLPTDGNHMGVAPDPDFVLLTLLADDSDPAAAHKYEQLTKLSAKAAGSNHPVSFSLAPTDRAESFPSTFLNDEGHMIFAAKIKTASGEMPFGIVLKGQAAQ